MPCYASFQARLPPVRRREGADARPIGFLAEIEGDAVSGEEHDAGEAGRDHQVGALEGRGPYAYLRDVLAR